jgi:hypothetical protein
LAFLVVLADAYLKNLTEGIDWNLGYEAVVSDAEGNIYVAAFNSELTTCR